MKVSTKDIRDFFKENKYSFEEMAEGDIAPYQLTEFLNSLFENERFMSVIKLNRALSSLATIMSIPPASSEMLAVHKAIAEAVAEIEDVKKKL